MRIKATIATIALATAVATAPASAAKLTVTQYGRIIATLPWAVALEKGMFKEAGLDIDGITAGSGGGTSLRNLLANELPIGEVSTSVVLAAAKTGREPQGHLRGVQPHRRTGLGLETGLRTSSRSRIWWARRSPSPIRARPRK